MKALLELRKKLKAKKPSFIRHDAHKKVRVGLVWRKPKGRQNKMRLHQKGYAKGRSTGYGSPRAVAGLSTNGLKQNVVHTLKDLISLDSKVDGIIIGRTVGLKKREVLVEEATKKGFTLLNVSKEKFTKKVEHVLAEKKANRAIVTKRRNAKAAAAKATSAKAKKEEAVKAEAKKAAAAKAETKVNPSDKKLAEKKEHDKVLTQKGDLQ